MIDFENYFYDEYQFSLKNAEYRRIDNNDADVRPEIQVRDRVDTSINNGNLEVTFERKVFFEPEALYAIDIAFTLILRFKPGQPAEDAAGIDWGEELKENGGIFWGNIVGRASYLIASLTSSYGQQPLVTPPSIIGQPR